jgi:carboxyl-terminal processing protease
MGRQLIVCKLETFSVERKYIDKMMAQASAFPNLILDLRGNGGGYVSIEAYLTGYFFDRDVKIGTAVSRSKAEERFAKPQKEKAYKGTLTVLIDSESASASEVFSRTIQLEKRGKVVGDISAGAVMTGMQGTAADMGRPGSTTYLLYGMSITVADLIMSDGNRLENVGVVPDLPTGPSSKALLENSDPVLAYAMSLFGVKISPADAGKLRFLTKKEEYEEKDNDKEEGGGKD